jgi:hypothetical protein
MNSSRELLLFLFSKMLQSDNFASFINPQVLALNTNVGQPSFYYGRRLSVDVGFLASPDAVSHTIIYLQFE